VLTDQKTIPFLQKNSQNIKLEFFSLSISYGKKINYAKNQSTVIKSATAHRAYRLILLFLKNYFI